MAKRVEALIKPELLVWARDSAGLSQEAVSRKLHVRPEKLDAWEKGEKHPTVKQLRKLGQVYKRPLAVFYLPEKPLDFQPLHDFRRIDGLLSVKNTAQLNFEIRRAVFRRQAALDLLEDLNEKPPALHPDINIPDDPETVGFKIRGLLGLSFEEQLQWSTEYQAFNWWRAAIENNGVLVFQCSGIKTEEMRGFSITLFPLPVIGLNIKDTPKGRIFSLLHEFTHIMIGESGICDIQEEFERRPAEQEFEVFCNHVAGAALVPKEYLLSERIVATKSNIEAWTDDELAALSRKFKVSREVILRRLLINRRTTEGFYRFKREQFQREYEKFKKKTEGFVPPYLKAISGAGLTFVRLVLNSYHQEKITSSDLSDYLEINLKHLPKIESEATMKFGEAY
jgi:Zn-dependent peptidase ImmA (M78 family)/DNA-binding XRE family transcriptional regulator